MKVFPGFFKPLLPGFLAGITIPPLFLQCLHLRGGNGKARLKRAGREWTVKITNGVITAEGWTRFATENGLEAGDIVKLDLVKEMVFEVSVFDRVTGCGKKMKREEYPSFTISVKGYNMRDRSVNIPMDFAQTNGLCDKRKVVLTDEGGRRRPEEVKLRKYSNGGRFRYHISFRGSQIFRGVEEGDAFKLQLVGNGAVPVLRIIPL